MLILSFDTATDVATSALVEDGEVRGERASVSRALLEDVDALLRDARVEPRAIDALVVGTGPGSFTSTRIGLAVARGLALALDLPVAGVSTLDALAAARVDAYPVVDARRGEVFVPPARPVPGRARADPGTVCVGNGAIRYRPRSSGRERSCRPTRTTSTCRARLHAALAVRFGPAEEILPLRARARREGTERRVNVELRRLEQRPRHRRGDRAHSYSTPWSRSMFAAELRKPSSIAIGAYLEEELVGYAFVSRYVDAWHVMNVAVSPAFRRRGVASTLLERLFEITADPRRAARSRCASPTRRRFGCTSGSASRPAASGAATTRTIVRTR